MKYKTSLRKEIISATTGNSGKIEFLEVYSDGDWCIVNHNTFSDDYIIRQTLKSLSQYDSFPCNTPREISNNITRNFDRIESEYLNNLINN